MSTEKKRVWEKIFVALLESRGDDEPINDIAQMADASLEEWEERFWDNEDNQ